MSFTTLPFLVLVALSVAAYYLLPQRVQWMALLAASMVFYCVGGGKTVLYVFYTAVIVYGSGFSWGGSTTCAGPPPKRRKRRSPRDTNPIAGLWFWSPAWRTLACSMC